MYSLAAMIVDKILDQNLVFYDMQAVMHRCMDILHNTSGITYQEIIVNNNLVHNILA